MHSKLENAPYAQCYFISLSLPQEQSALSARRRRFIEFKCTLWNLITGEKCWLESSVCRTHIHPRDYFSTWLLLFATRTPRCWPAEGWHLRERDAISSHAAWIFWGNCTKGVVLLGSIINLCSFLTLPFTASSLFMQFEMVARIKRIWKKN